MQTTANHDGNTIHPCYTEFILENIIANLDFLSFLNIKRSKPHLFCIITTMVADTRSQGISSHHISYQLSSDFSTKGLILSQEISG